mmetsp:Transcript_16680/g.46113  ORF Transcript_16680/g.46113 Transcript_16680/m.46113 type:complete len:85 (+) Transcript_16680:32-286(+)
MLSSLRLPTVPSTRLSRTTLSLHLTPNAANTNTSHAAQPPCSDSPQTEFPPLHLHAEKTEGDDLVQLWERSLSSKNLSMAPTKR